MRKILLILLFLTPGAIAGPVATIADLEGGASILAPGQKSVSARLLSQLEPSTRLKVQKNSRVALAFFSDGRRIVLAGPCEVKITTNDVERLSGVETSIERRQVRGKGKVQLKPVGSTMGGVYNRDPFGFTILSRGLQASPEPRLEWTQHEQALSYRVQVLKGGGTVLQKTLEATSIQRVPLEAGKYTMVVEALDDMEHPVATSKATLVLSEPVLGQLAPLRERAEAELVESPDDLSPNILLLDHYHQNSCYWDAFQIVRHCLKKRPDDETLREMRARLLSRLQ